MRRKTLSFICIIASCEFSHRHRAASGASPPIPVQPSPDSEPPAQAPCIETTKANTREQACHDNSSIKKRTLARLRALLRTPSTEEMNAMSSALAALSCAGADTASAPIARVYRESAIIRSKIKTDYRGSTKCEIYEEFNLI